MSIYLLSKKAQRHKKEKERNRISPFYLNMTHTGRLITKCNINTPTPAPQKCYGQYMKKKVKEYVESRPGVTYKRMPEFMASQHTSNLTSMGLMDKNCCPIIVPPKCYRINSKRHGSTITKDVGKNKSSSWQIAKVKAARVNICDEKCEKYETPIYGNRPGGCRN